MLQFVLWDCGLSQQQTSHFFPSSSCSHERNRLCVTVDNKETIVTLFCGKNQAPNPSVMHCLIVHIAVLTQTSHISILICTQAYDCEQVCLEGYAIHVDTVADTLRRVTSTNSDVQNLHNNNHIGKSDALFIDARRALERESEGSRR
jgi:hypothetical protein